MASRTEAAQIHKGHLMVLPDPALPASAKSKWEGKAESDFRVMAFQYNPESVTRTRKGEWTKDHTRAGAEQIS